MVSAAHELFDYWLGCCASLYGKQLTLWTIDGVPYFISGGSRKKDFSPGISNHSRPRFLHRASGLGFDRKRVHGGSGALDSQEESNSDSFRSVIDDLTIKSTDLSLNFITTSMHAEGYQIKNSRSA